MGQNDLEIYENLRFKDFSQGFEDPTTPMAVVHTDSTKEPRYCYKDADALYRYMEENIRLIAKVVEEFKLCCDYYDVGYSKKQNAVVFRGHVFHNIDELWKVFLEDFRKLNIPDDEIRRIFEEESHSFYQRDFNKIQRDS